MFLFEKLPENSCRQLLSWIFILFLDGKSYTITFTKICDFVYTKRKFRGHGGAVGVTVLCEGMREDDYRDAKT